MAAASLSSSMMTAHSIPTLSSSTSTASTAVTVIPAPRAPPSQGLRVPSNRKTIYDRNLNRTQTADLSRASFAYLFSEMVSYAQKRVTGIADLERRLNEQGYPLGLRLLSLLAYRAPPPSRSSGAGPVRPHRILALLQFITTTLWKHLFGRNADALERSQSSHLEYYVVDNDPLVNMFISVPKEMSQLNCGAYIAGVIEGVCDGGGLTAKVNAHNGGNEMWPGRTVWLVRFEEGIVDREAILEKVGKS